MKKQIRKIFLIAVLVFCVCTLIWRVAPLSFERITSIDENDITDFSAVVSIQRVENGNVIAGGYQKTEAESQEEMLQDILNLFNESKYRQDFRNLLPWRVDRISGGRLYDGTFVMLIFSIAASDVQYIQVDYLSPNTIVVSVSGNDHWRVYHPANHDLQDKIAQYIQAHDDTQ